MRSASALLVGLMVASVTLTIGCCDRASPLRPSSSYESEILATNSSGSSTEDHKFRAENVLTSLLKLSQERRDALEPQSASNLTVEEKWVSAVSFISSLTTVAIKASLPLSVSLSGERGLSAGCSASLLLLLSGLRKNQGWAFACKYLKEWMERACLVARLTCSSLTGCSFLSFFSTPAPATHATENQLSIPAVASLLAS